MTLLYNMNDFYMEPSDKKTKKWMVTYINKETGKPTVIIGVKNLTINNKQIEGDYFSGRYYTTAEEAGNKIYQEIRKQGFEPFKRGFDNYFKKLP